MRSGCDDLRGVQSFELSALLRPVCIQQSLRGSGTHAGNQVNHTQKRHNCLIGSNSSLEAHIIRATALTAPWALHLLLTITGAVPLGRPAQSALSKHPGGVWPAALAVSLPAILLQMRKEMSGRVITPRSDQSVRSENGGGIGKGTGRGRNFKEAARKPDAKRN